MSASRPRASRRLAYRRGDCPLHRVSSCTPSSRADDHATSRAEDRAGTAERWAGVWLTDEARQDVDAGRLAGADEHLAGLHVLQILHGAQRVRHQAHQPVAVLAQKLACAQRQHRSGSVDNPVAAHALRHVASAESKHNGTALRLPHAALSATSYSAGSPKMMHVKVLCCSRQSQQSGQRPGLARGAHRRR